MPSADSNLFHLLVQAWIDCRRTKRTSASAQAFEAQAEHHLYTLYEALASCAYRPGRSICFVVLKPRPREVWAAEFGDRIVHWLLYNHIAPRFHAGFIADSFACIPERGTQRAAESLERHVRSVTENWSRPAHYLKCDLANFFVSIHKPTLLAQLRRKVTEPWWLWLAETILMHDPRDNVRLHGTRQELALVPPHKSLFNAPEGYGLPIGNLSSQFFANVLLDGLDQFVKHQLRARHYLRYVDDFVLLHRDARWLGAALPRIEGRLAELHLQLNPRKTVRQPVDRGIDFVGQVVLPWRRIPRPRTVRNAMQRVHEAALPDLHASINSHFGTLRQASHSHAIRAQLANLARRRGLSVAADATQAFIPRHKESP